MKEKYIELIGIISGSLSASAFIPQVLEVIKNNSVEGLSSRTYTIYTLSLIGWIVYGWQKPDYLIILFNAITLFLTGIVDIYFLLSIIKK
jgi:MtN3 and saliva related transmembrane protein